MSDESKKVGCVIVAHGNLGACLMDAVQGILGKQSGWVAVSNAGLGLRDLADAVRRAVEELSRTHDVLIMTDMPGGSCHHVCQELVRGRTDVRALTGVNLMVFLEFFVKRDRYGVNELLPLLVERGRGSVRIV
jgi:mannose/fructose-specific phosphotransferase system component IIA